MQKFLLLIILCAAPFIHADEASVGVSDSEIERHLGLSQQYTNILKVSYPIVGMGTSALSFTAGYLLLKSEQSGTFAPYLAPVIGGLYILVGSINLATCLYYTVCDAEILKDAGSLAIFSDLTAREKIAALLQKRNEKMASESLSQMTQRN